MKTTTGQLRRIIREAVKRQQGTESSGARVETTVKDLRKLVREEAEYLQAITELLGEGADFGSLLDSVLQDLYATNKKIEQAHELAPQGPAKAIVAGLHSDLFNQAAEFRKYVEQLKKMAKGGGQPTARA